MIPIDTVLWLRGTRAGLGPLRVDLVESYWRWENDPQVRLGYGQQSPQSLEERRERLLRQLGSWRDEARFTIYDVSGDRPIPIGTTALVVDHPRRTAEFFILIGDAARRSRGVGTEATRLTLDYGFHITSLRCIHLRVLAPNTPAIRAYEKAGFQVIGTRRGSGYWLGAPTDEVLMDAVPEEFCGPSAVRDIVAEQRTSIWPGQDRPESPAGR